MQVTVNPAVLEWAARQSGLPLEAVHKSFPSYEAWVKEERRPTVAQLEAFARKTHVPFGYLLLNEVPELSQPRVRDFRTLGNASVDGYSRNLLDTIKQMRVRQEWLHEYKKAEDYHSVAFVGSLNQNVGPSSFVEQMFAVLQVETDWQREVHTKEEAFNFLREHVEQAGVIVFVNGIVGNDTHRRLSLREFRGFALADDYAPLIFINGADAPAGRLFTLVHELVHLFLGRDGLDDGTEQFCNEIAAAFLVQVNVFHEAWRQHAGDFSYLEQYFKVSRQVLFLVALRRHYISQAEYDAALAAYQKDMKDVPKRGAGGDFYKTLPNRIGRSFSRYVFTAVREGSMLYRDAYSLLGLRGRSFQHAMKLAEGAV